ncbi:MAG: hypothetical protein PHI55_05720 [Burkholderiaceae bacterium]|nr:hypothetical protein [Burkholderiaceae bacterium]
MATPDLGACLSTGMALFKKNPFTHIGATALVGIVGGMSMGLLYGPMLVGYMRMIDQETQGGQARLGDVFRGFDDFVPALLAVLISSIVVWLGFFLCFFPGLLVLALIPTSAFLVARGQRDGVAAFQGAWAAVRPHFLTAFVSMLVLGFVGSLGSLLCGVGVFLTLPIAMIGMHTLARQLTEDAGAVFVG